MSNLQVVTGATGFIGGALVLELLRTTEARIACGVRCAGDAGLGQERLQRSLSHAAQAYGAGERLPDIAARCVAFPFDMTEAPGKAALFPRLGEPTTFWHAAASLRFEEKHRAQIFKDNVDGTRNVLALARDLGVERFNYISTAYVAGRREGLILEELPDGSVTTSNCYEESKLEAERLVWAAKGFESRILRPTIVIGHRRTLAATSFTGLYGFLREARAFERQVRHRLGNILRMRPLSVRVATQAPINFIPVDVVGRDAVRIGLADTDDRVFHLCNDTNPSIGPVLDVVFEELGLAKPRHVSSSGTFTSLDQVLADALAFYSSYMNSSKTFSRKNTDAVVGEGSGRVPLPPERIRAFARWYLEKLETEEREIRRSDRPAPPAARQRRPTYKQTSPR